VRELVIGSADKRRSANWGDVVTFDRERIFARFRDRLARQLEIDPDNEIDSDNIVDLVAERVGTGV
jgi:hypothetical protein